MKALPDSGSRKVLFSSVLFIAYFLPLALLLYHRLCAFSLKAQNLCLLLVSCLFYAFGEPLHMIPLLLVILVNYVLGLQVRPHMGKANKVRVIKIASVLNIGILAFFRYAGPFTAFVCELAGIAPFLEMPRPPLGLAFFTLQGLAYIFDLCRGKAPRDKNIINAGLYIAFFPTVLFGPILKYGDLAAQITGRISTPALMGKGVTRFICGLAKLVLIATPIAVIANYVFILSAQGQQVADVPVMLAWLGLFAFSLQFYLAFSAYSDIAVGLAAMFGFTLAENFNYPYMAKTFIDFCKRWHISLFRWFFVYVYLPMGGQRPKVVKRRGGGVRPHNFVLRNLFVMWALIGLWHGVSWTFFLWSMWFFILYLLEWIVKLPLRNLSSPLWRVYLFLVVGIGWIFFRCDSVNNGMNFLANMLGLSSNGFYSEIAVVFLQETWAPLLAGILLCTPALKHCVAWIDGNAPAAVRYPLAALYTVSLFGLLALSLIYLSRATQIPLLFQ